MCGKNFCRDRYLKKNAGILDDGNEIVVDFFLLILFIYSEAGLQCEMSRTLGLNSKLLVCGNSPVL